MIKEIYKGDISNNAGSIGLCCGRMQIGNITGVNLSGWKDYSFTNLTVIPSTLMV